MEARPRVGMVPFPAAGTAKAIKSDVYLKPGTGKADGISSSALLSATGAIHQHGHQALPASPQAIYRMAAITPPYARPVIVRGEQCASRRTGSAPDG
jgi:hypothetical protein